MRKDCSNMDGVIEDFDAITTMNPIGNRFDQDNFYPANGIVENYNAVLADTPIGNAFDQDNFYPANGLGSKLRKKAKNSRAGKKLSKFKAQRQQSREQKDVQAANALAKSGKNEKVVVNKTNQPLKVELEPKGMSMGTKVAIGLAIATVLGIGAYFIIKRRNK